MEFPGDHSHSAQFIVTEESIRFWAYPWEELDVNSSNKPNAANKRLKRGYRFTPYRPAPSVRKQWLIWSLLSVAYMGTVSFTGFIVHEAVDNRNAPPSQSFIGDQIF